MIKKDNMKNTVIFDLDGTLALIDKRRALAGVIPGAPEASNPQMNWKVFLDPENIFLDEIYRILVGIKILVVIGNTLNSH